MLAKEGEGGGGGGAIGFILTYLELVFSRLGRGGGV